MIIMHMLPAGILQLRFFIAFLLANGYNQSISTGKKLQKSIFNYSRLTGLCNKAAQKGGLQK